MGPYIKVVDLSDFVRTGVCSPSLAGDVLNSFTTTSCVLVKDPSLEAVHNDQFLDMMEQYFEQTEEQKMKDARPELKYQVGVTPGGIEKPRCLSDNGEMLSQACSASDDDKPIAPTGPDCKWRFMWRIGPRPESTNYATLNAEQVCPAAGFPDWSTGMTSFGQGLLSSVRLVARALAVGANMDPNYFVDMMEKGPHLLAPTGTDLREHKVADCFAGYHYDINFLTIHGKARFPGLNIWTRCGKKLEVAVPRGCLLLQAGKQLEWLTGGAITAGMHEVVCSEKTIAAAENAQSQGRSLWRVSSTLFSHIASDQTLKPIQNFDKWPGWDSKKYKPMPAGELVSHELSLIKLASVATDV